MSYDESGEIEEAYSYGNERLDYMNYVSGGVNGGATSLVSTATANGRKVASSAVVGKAVDVVTDTSLDVAQTVTSGGKVTLGSVLVRTEQGGGLQSQLDLALNPSWGNTTENVTKIVVPKGTIIFEGTAAPQNILDSYGNKIGNLQGGGNQIYIPEVNERWFE